MPAHRFELPATKVEFVQCEGDEVVRIIVHSDEDKPPFVYEVSTELSINNSGRTATAVVMLQNVTSREDDIPI